MTSKETQNHGIEVPLDGYETADPSYADLYEGAFDDLDERVPIVDVAAERDAYEPYADALFVASDTGQVSIGTGTDWEFRGVVPNDDDVISAIDGADISPETLTATSASVGSADIGTTPTNRPIISNGVTEIYVDPAGDDSNDGTQTDPVATIQEAVDRVPFLLRHRYQINVASGTYNEDVEIHSVISTAPNSETGSGEPVIHLRIEGDPDTPSNVEVDSMIVDGCIGTASPQIMGFRFLSDNPNTNENVSFTAYGSREVQLRDAEFGADANGGVVAYNSSINVRNLDLGTDNLGKGLHTKRDGTIKADNVSGSVTGAAFYANGAGDYLAFGNCTLTGNPTVGQQDGGIVYDLDTGEVEWGDPTLQQSQSRYTGTDDSAEDSVSEPVIYRSAGTGSSYPFDGWGNLVLQSRPDGNQDVVIIAGDTQDVVARVKPNGDLDLAGSVNENVTF